MNYREQFYEGEIDGKTLLDVIDEKEAEAQALRERLAFAEDAAAKGDDARAQCGGMEMEIQALRGEVEALRARAVVPDCPDCGPWTVSANGRRVDIQSDDFTHDVALVVTGDFADGEMEQYARKLAAWMNARLNGKTVSEGLLRRIIQHLEWNGTEDQDITVMDYIRRGDSMAEELRALLGEGKEHE